MGIPEQLGDVSDDAFGLCVFAARRRVSRNSPRRGRFPFDGLWASDQAWSREQIGIALNLRNRGFPSVRPRSVSNAEDEVPPVMLRERLGDFALFE